MCVESSIYIYLYIIIGNCTLYDDHCPFSLVPFKKSLSVSEYYQRIIIVRAECLKRFASKSRGDLRCRVYVCVYTHVSLLEERGNEIFVDPDDILRRSL